MASTDHMGESAAEPYYSRRRRRGTGSRILRAIVALVMATVVGAIAAVAAAELGYAGPAFVLAFVATAAYLYAKPVPSDALGSGLYLAALGILLTPVLYLLPEALGDGAVDVSEANPIVDDLFEAAGDGAATAGAAVDETLTLFETGVDAAEDAVGEPFGLAAWALAFVALAAVLVVLGYLAKRRARRALERDEWTADGPESRRESERPRPRSDGGRPRSERDRGRSAPDRRPIRSEPGRRRGRRGRPGPERRRPRSVRDRRRFGDEPRRR